MADIDSYRKLLLVDLKLASHSNFTNIRLLRSFLCRPFDIYVYRRLNYISDLNFKSSSQIDDPDEIFIHLNLTPESNQLKLLFQNFLERNLSKSKDTAKDKNIKKSKDSNLHIHYQACFLAFVSYFPEIVVKVLQESNELNNIISNILVMLTNKKEASNLALDVALLSYLLESHPSCSNILSESNISQLIKLCLAKALYPSDNPTLLDSGSNLQKYTAPIEIGSSLLGLKRLLEIPHVLSSAVADKEIELFVKKWWNRLVLSSIKPDNPGSFILPDHPSSVENLERQNIPILRTVFEIFDLCALTFKSSREYLLDVILQEDSTDFSFLNKFLFSKDIPTAIASINFVVKFLKIKSYRDFSNSFKEFMISDNLTHKLQSRLIDLLLPIEMDSSDMHSSSSSSPMRSTKFEKKPFHSLTPSTSHKMPRKRMSYSSHRKPFQDISNQITDENEFPLGDNVVDNLYPLEEENVFITKSHLKIINEPLIVTLLPFLEIVLSWHNLNHRPMVWGGKDLKSTILESLFQLLEIFTLDENVLASKSFYTTTGGTTTTNPIELCIRSAISALKMLGVSHYSDLSGTSSLGQSFVVHFVPTIRAKLIAFIDKFSLNLNLSEMDREFLHTIFSLREAVEQNPNNYDMLSDQISKIKIIENENSMMMLDESKIFSPTNNSCHNFSFTPEDIIIHKQQNSMITTSSSSSRGVRPMNHDVVGVGVGVEALVLKKQLETCLSEAADLRSQLGESFLENDKLKADLEMSNNKINVQEKILKETYEKLQVLAKKDHSTASECEMLRSRSDRLVNESNQLQTSLSQLNLHMIEKVTLVDHYKEKYEEEKISLFTVKQKYSEEIHGLEQKYTTKIQELEHVVMSLNEQNKKEIEKNDQLVLEKELLEENQLNFLEKIKDLELDIQSKNDFLESANQEINSLNLILKQKEISIDDLSKELQKQKEILCYINKISIQNGNVEIS